MFALQWCPTNGQAARACMFDKHLSPIQADACSQTNTRTIVLASQAGTVRYVGDWTADDQHAKLLRSMQRST